MKFYDLRNKRESFICYRYFKLCQLLPVTPHEYISLAKQQLGPGNNELKDTGFISKYEWSENGKKDWLICYWPGERAKEEIRRAETKSIDNWTPVYVQRTGRGGCLPDPREEVNKYSKEQVDLVNELLSRIKLQTPVWRCSGSPKEGSSSFFACSQKKPPAPAGGVSLEVNVSKVTAENLIKNNDQEAIEKWLEAINYSNADDKAAYIVKAIRENWQVPEEYLREIKEKQRREEEEKIKYIKIERQEEKNKKRREEIKKIEQIYNSFGPSQQEENKLPRSKLRGIRP